MGRGNVKGSERGANCITGKGTKRRKRKEKEGKGRYSERTEVHFFCFSSLSLGLCFFLETLLSCLLVRAVA